MKKTTLFLTAILYLSFASAQDAKTVFNGEKIIFYGLDFSKAKLNIPDGKPAELKDVYIPKWNELIMTDNGRFPKESAFQKITVYGDPTTTDKRNAAISAGNIVGKRESGISKETIEQMIGDYTDGKRKEGLGVVLIVESFDKKKEEAVAHVVFFDIATRKVLLAKKLTGRPGGGGLTNYWARTFQQMFEDMTNTLFGQWKKEVMGK